MQSTSLAPDRIHEPGYVEDRWPVLPEPTPEDVRRASALFKVLSHPDRLALACRLGDGRETTQTELLEVFDWPQSTMARHLAALRQVGLVAAERAGAEVVLRLATPLSLQLLETVCGWLHGEKPGAGAEPFQGSLPPTRRAASAGGESRS